MTGFSDRSSAIPMTILTILIIGFIALPAALTAEVVKVEITSREIVHDWRKHSHFGPYEVIKGIIYLEVDPDNPANQMIVDLKLAKRNRRGNVEFSTEFELHKPVDASRGNRRLIYFVNNRGNRLGSGALSFQAGRNWFYSHGWSYVWCGWNCDVIESDRKLNINVPVINENGKAITGKVYAQIYSYADNLVYSMPFVWGGSVAYPVVDLDNTHASLTMKKYPWDKPISIPRSKWAFARFQNGQVIPDSANLYLKEGFKPGWLYDLVYTGKDPKVTGLGMAAIRDVISFLKYENEDRTGIENPLAGLIEYTHAWGHSQSGRLLNHFVYQNFNGDEKGRKVLDGIISNCPGGGKGQFNSRFAQMTRHGSHLEDNLYPIDFFPFTTMEQIDPVTGEQGDALAASRKSGYLPKLFYINSSTDYWTRAASLLHTDVQGTEDAAIDPDVRIYAIAGRAHTENRNGIIGRALLVALDQWVSQGIEPPESEIPKISDGMLVTLETWRERFPEIPGVRMPESFYHPYRLDPGPRWKKGGIADNVPPKTGPRYVCLVPQVDEDGNEIAGIHLPEVSVPLATYTGWSMRPASFSNTLRRNAGRVWVMPANPEERQEKGDPRKSILERYPAKKDFLFEVMKSLLSLNKKRFILDEDMDHLLTEAAELNYWTLNEEDMLVSIRVFSILPADVARGDSIKITVIPEGDAEDIMSIQVVWRETPRIKLILNDDGNKGDEVENDNIWSLKTDIGMYFPLGTFNFDVHAYDKNWNPIYLKGTMTDGFGKWASTTMTVK